MNEHPKKAVVLARGLGTRLRAASVDSKLSPEQERIANAGIKALMPVGKGRVMLDLIVDSLCRAGFSQICLVIGPEHGLIREHCYLNGIDAAFAIQQEPRGTADAVLAAESFIERDELFAVVNSDNLYPVDCLAKLRENAEQGLLAFERSSLIANSNIPEERIAKFATLDLDADGFLQQVTEKPTLVDKNSYISMNAWLFSSAILQACHSISPSERSELELTTAVQFAIDELGEKFRALPVSSGVLDLSNRGDVAGLARALENFS